MEHEKRKEAATPRRKKKDKRETPWPMAKKEKKDYTSEGAARKD